MYYVVTKVMSRYNTRYQLNFINNYSRCNYILYDKSEIVEMFKVISI